ncbi:uncharacterized protein B0H18DRAFT_1205322 [Fomitopsis serialis]|uniref:uncharacterized protein n=1 Tax=Fomitopsis serialis TaxID=139415 RepID=UPI0020078F46|nr:uncharacterized protein B0H18DRAFT_1205322 [Neoantrodia serialis]KAH9938010.1 hypothetical protein B0H18DRAFT_1205322 [Neoantrodia serialis]
MTIPTIARAHLSADTYDYCDVLATVAEDSTHAELWTAGNIDSPHPLFVIDHALLQLTLCPLNNLTLTNVDASIRVPSLLSFHILSGWSHLSRLAFVGCSHTSAWLSLLRAGALPALDLLVLSHSDYDLHALVDALSTRVATHLRPPSTSSSLAPDSALLPPVQLGPRSSHPSAPSAGSSAFAPCRPDAGCRMNLTTPNRPLPTTTTCATTSPVAAAPKMAAAPKTAAKVTQMAATATQTTTTETTATQTTTATKS